jgi:hypothetical protein
MALKGQFALFWECLYSNKLKKLSKKIKIIEGHLLLPLKLRNVFCYQRGRAHINYSPKNLFDTLFL